MDAAEALLCGVSPAMAAGVTDHLWDASELVSLLEAEEVEKSAA
jgi:hypothetical protein